MSGLSPAFPEMRFFAPRAIRRQTIAIDVSAFELSLLIGALERMATDAAEDPLRIDYADYLFCRIAALRECAR
jgi:hypothetical protein